MAFLALVAVFLVGGVANAAPPSVSLQVSTQLFDLNGSVAAKVTVQNTDAATMSLTIADAYQNRETFDAVQPGDSVVVVLQTGESAVAGYTVQVIAKTADGRGSARGYAGGDLHAPVATPHVQSPVRYCEGPNYDFGRCLAQWANIPLG